MRLGIDLDGTVADLQAALAREAAILFPGIDPATLPRSLSPAAPPNPGANPEADSADAPSVPNGDAKVFSTSSLTSRQQRELWRSVCARVNFWETLDEIEPGA